MDRPTLLRRIAEQGERPFQNEVTKSPWDSVIDVPGLNRAVKNKVVELARECLDPRRPRCLVVKSNAGFGKTHLLACVRGRMEEGEAAGFVSIPPYRVVDGPLENHLLAATADSLFRHSRVERRRLEANAVGILVRTFNDLIKTPAGRTTLGVSLTLWQRLHGESPAIGDLPGEEQLDRIRPHLRQRAFMDRAFAEFRDSQAADAPAEVSLDRDTFCAACLLALGDADRHWLAERWFRNRPMEAEEREQIHADGPAEPLPRVKDALWTLHRLLGKPLCLCFDQMEDTVRSFQESKALEERLSQFAHAVEAFYTVPGVCFVFCMQESVWEGVIAAKTPTHFIRRMTEGHGPQNLEVLTPATARELIARRMEAEVWKPLGLSPPDGQPTFPFGDAELEHLVRESHAVVYQFLQFARVRYLRHLEVTPFRLVGVVPDHGPVVGGVAVEIRGENLPPRVTVMFGTKAAVPAECDLIRMIIRTTAPAGTAGPATVRVTAVPPDGRSEELTFQYDAPVAVPTTREQRVGDAVKKARLRRGCKQVDVANQLGGDWTATRVSEVERGVEQAWVHYQRLAAHFQVALEEGKKAEASAGDGGPK